MQEIEEQFKSDITSIMQMLSNNTGISKEVNAQVISYMAQCISGVKDSLLKLGEVKGQAKVIEMYPKQENK